ncbi:hypothetical protein TNIN_468341 [Trichonephila inaurata madagascariensis]|uniref:Uncharacterized protein n=1 Tax=Trichonephila inaurata madagascariensis TaxID=2747483 RepID=A0A8X6YI71_9ARAC|nr:hypothetical protein TNIN_468341 [Trichonephila inaurata madagascariensis]
MENSTVILRFQRTFWQRNNKRKPVKEWFARFISSDTSLEDKPVRSWPSEFDDQAHLAPENTETCPLKEGYVLFVVGQKRSWNRPSIKQMGSINESRR